MDLQQRITQAGESGAALLLRAGQVWESSGFADHAERIRRHPYFPPTAIGALILISLVISGVTADESLTRSFRVVTLTIYDNSNAWWAMPSALAALVTLSFSRRMQGVPWKLLATAAALVGFVWAHTRLGERGPLPYLALRETSDLFAYLLLAIALWRYGKLYPLAAPLIAALGFVLILLSRLGIEAERALFRPDLFVLLCSIPLALSAAFDARQAAPFRDHPRADGAPEPRPGGQFLVLFAGSVAGGVLQKIELYRHGATETTDALGALWAQSGLAGHGYSVTMRLLRAWTEPMAVAEPRWMGWTGFLATGGLLAVGVLAAMSAVLVTREYLGRMEHRAAALAAQFVIGLTLVGGPNSLVPLLVLIVWIALALSTPLAGATGRRLPDDPARQRIYKGAMVAAVVTLAVMCLNFRGPFAASSELGKLGLETEADAPLKDRLAAAERRLPWHPVPHIIRAAWLRGELTRSPKWDENLYRAICAEYEAAMALDPYEPTIALKLAEVQSIAERTAAAMETARAAMTRTPGSADLLAWVYFHARTNNQAQAAADMIERSLYLQPEAPLWWRNRFWFEQAAGRGPSATVALNVAMTAAVGNPREGEAEWILTCFERSEGKL